MTDLSESDSSHDPDMHGAVPRPARDISWSSIHAPDKQSILFQYKQVHLAEGTGRLEEMTALKGTLSFLLTAAWAEIFPNRHLIIDHAYLDGLFCYANDHLGTTEADCEELTVRMQEWLNSAEISNELLLSFKPREDVCHAFVQRRDFCKMAVMKAWRVDPVPIIQFREHWDYRVAPMSVNIERLCSFRLEACHFGMLLRVPTLRVPHTVPLELLRQPKLFRVQRKAENFGERLHCGQVGQINAHIFNKTFQQLIWVSEANHEKQMAELAASIVSQTPQKRIICIAGPSSSGKTTFAYRLGVHLRVAGFEHSYLGMDDYFKDVEEIEIDSETGMKNFESLAAVHVDLLATRCRALLRGDAIPKRHFDFESHRGIDHPTETVALRSDEFLIIEGIHMLNPQLTGAIGAEDVFRVFISPLCCVNLDDTHPVATSDVRLLRRMVRDYKYRGYGAKETLDRWQSVREGEHLYIFPHQSQADFFFNSVLYYELPVLAQYAIPLLLEVQGSPALLQTANRLLTICQCLYPVPEYSIPGTSLLREFIGGSDWDVHH